MSKRIALLNLLLTCSVFAIAQMSIDGTDYYGNEWIDYDNQYLKLTLEEDGMYQLSYSDMVAAGFGTSIQGSELQLYYRGNQIAISTSTDGTFTSTDYIRFYGEKNDGWLDQFLFKNTSDQLNPEYSLYTDKSAYFLTVGNADQSLRYEESTQLPDASLQAEQYYMHDEKMVFSQYHSHTPANSGNSLNLSSFIPADGYGSELKSDFETVIPSSNKYTGTAPVPYISIRQGVYQGAHASDIFVNDQLRKNQNHLSLSVNQYNIELSISDVLSQTKLRIIDLKQNDKSVKSIIDLVYPREFVATDANYFQFSVDPDQTKRYFEIEGMDISQDVAIYDLTNQKLISSTLVDGQVRFVLPPISKRTQLVLTTTYKSVVESDTRTFTEYSNLNPDYLILTSEALNYAGSGVEKYAEYRQSEAGGGHNVVVLNTEDIVDQFGYGVDGHCIGINNFIRKQSSDWSELDHVFLLGKGLDYHNYRIDPSYHLPTWGYPGSDNLLLAAKGKSHAMYKTGRLAARNNQVVLDYLDKVKNYEDRSDLAQSIEDKAWMKRVIHLSGGKTPGEQAQLNNYLNSMRDSLTDSRFGAEVTSFRKSTSNNTSTSVSEQIKEIIDDGIGLLTFFGHSSTGTFDFSIEDPTEYHNQDNLPVILSLGCHAGDVHSHATGLSEKFVTQKDVGSIAFLASSGNAELTSQYLLGSHFYEGIGDENYELNISENFWISNRYLDELGGDSPNFKTLTEQFSFHGDPAIQFVSNEGPDYVPALSNISVSPEEIGSSLDSITVNFDVYNIGSWTEEALRYMIIHDYEEGIDTIYGSTITPRYAKTVSKKFPINGNTILGKNTIDIVIDYPEDIVELPNPAAEDNNRLSKAYGVEGYTFFGYDESVNPVHPYEFSIQTDNDITLKASTFNAFLRASDYVFEIDTTELFNSPIKQSQVVEGTGGLIEWKPTVDYKSNTVYYWRVKSDATENDVWKKSSFVYYPEKSEGWNQSHFYQKKKDDFTRLALDQHNQLVFPDRSVEHKVFNLISRSGENPTYSIDNTSEEFNYYNAGFGTGFYVVVINPETSEPWILEQNSNQYGAFSGGSYNRDRKAFPFFVFNAARRNQLASFLQDSIPNGHYVMVYSIQSDAAVFDASGWDADAAQYGKTIFSVLEDQGATKVGQLREETKPYIFAYQKGVGPIKEELATNVEEEISVTIIPQVKFVDGLVRSTLIGPAKQWQTLKWDVVEEQNNDLYGITIYGVDQAGNRAVIVENLQQKSANLSNIDATIYPNLVLEYSVRDSIDRTPAKLDYWRVYFEGLPEAVIDASDNFVFNSSSLSRGQQLELSYDVENVSDIDMDSLVVHYSIVDKSNHLHEWEEIYDPLLANGTSTNQISFNTQLLQPGEHELTVTINPDYRQPEQHIFNNRGILKFKVIGDNLNPLLTVTFDDLLISNGDVVSPQPEILIRLQDSPDAPALDDPSLFEIALTYPDGTVQFVDSSNQDFRFESANTDNQARVYYTPTLSSGIYTLSVQGRDKEGNLSGIHEYKVTFEVVSELYIGDFYNYPNPFSVSTKFVYTTTGDRLPEDFDLIIFNSLGQIVREISDKEFNKLPVGRDRIYYQWDGTDGKGNILENGVYFYKLVLVGYKGGKSRGKNSPFSKGNGKVILQR